MVLDGIGQGKNTVNLHFSILKRFRSVPNGIMASQKEDYKQKDREARRNQKEKVKWQRSEMGFVKIFTLQHKNHHVLFA